MGLGALLCNFRYLENGPLFGWNDWYVKRSSIINYKVESNLAHLLLELDIMSELNEKASIFIEEPNAQITFESSIDLKKGNNFFREKFSISNPKFGGLLGMVNSFYTILMFYKIN